MNKIRVVNGLFLLSLFVGMVGCEGFDKPNYIIVTLECNPIVVVKDGGNEYPASNVLVEIEVINAGGERVSNLVSTNSGGVGVTVSGTFNVYRGKSVTCIGNLVPQSAEGQYPEYAFNSAVETILWPFILQYYDFGDHAEF